MVRDRRAGTPSESTRVAAVHLRPPSLDRGLVSFLWAFGLALYLWLFMVAVGVARGTALMLALLSFAGIFLFVRTRGEDI